ncbi:hypothetical protein [Actinomyces denticolens]|uniref:hypothetical protein n=1 Tax=Actinomyces denticolens TaxID=52767 RepID=UPI0011612098|nr:hypothetical protein [Actinomyces denticolens]
MPNSPFFFPDNTVLIDLAILDRVDLLSWFLRGRGRWCKSVEWEWRQSIKALSLQRADREVRGACGSAILPDEREQIDINILVDSLRSPGDPWSRRRGEAETVVLIRNRADLHGSVFISDDAGALRLAGRELLGTKRYTTVDVLIRAEIAGRITAEQAHDYLRRLRQGGRHVRPAGAVNYDARVAALRAALARSRGARS